MLWHQLYVANKSKQSHKSFKITPKMYPYQLVAALLFCVAALATADDTGCGGLLQGEYGRFQYPGSQRKPTSTVSSCLWTIQLPSGSDIRFTLDTLSSDSQLVLYPEQNPTRRALSSVTLNPFDVGSSVKFKGRTLIVILPNPDSDFSFTWESLSENEEKVVVSANYIYIAEGSLEWRQRRSSERLTFAMNVHDSAVISYRTTMEPYTCQSEDPCQCFYFGIFEVAPSGSLVEARRICGETSSEGTLAKSSSHVVAFVYTDAELSDLNKVEISWQSQPGITTDTTTSTTTTASTTTTTEVPPDDAIGILAATTAGLVAVSLATLNTTVISPSDTTTVVFDTKTSKAIWSEYSSIKRAHPNGTELEVLKTGTGLIYGMAIDTLTGNVYYGDYSGDRIMACNSEVQDCVAVATAPVVGYPNGIAVHVQRRQLYWTNGGFIQSISKANLDGTNTTQIVHGLNAPNAIVVDSDNDRLYWTETFGEIIRTSDLEGGNGRTLVELTGSPWPFGLVMHMNLLYIGNLQGRNVQSVDKNSGVNLTTVYSTNGQVRHLAIIESTARHCASYDNPCERNACSHLCVPSIYSYRCLCPENMYLGSNQATCLPSK